MKQQEISWAAKPECTRLLAPNEQLRVRPGLLYSISDGVIKLQSADTSCILGFVDSCFQVPEGIEAYAHTQCTISWHYWEDLTIDNKAQAREMICEEHLWSIQHSACLGGKSSDMVYNILLYLGKRFGQFEEGSYTLPWAITHEAIAQTINTTRVTVTRTISVLRSKRVIKVLPLSNLIKILAKNNLKHDMM